MAQQIALQGQVDPTKLRFLYEHNDDGVYIFVCVSVPVFTHGMHALNMLMRLVNICYLT